MPWLRLSPFILLPLLAGPAAAQMPQDPAGSSMEECRYYRDAFYAHLHSLRMQGLACERQYPPKARWVTVRRASCGTSMFYWGPDGCQSFEDQLTCDRERGNAVYNACYRSARLAERQANQNVDTFSRRVAMATMSGLPGSLASMGTKLVVHKYPELSKFERGATYVRLFRAMNDEKGSFADKVGAMSGFLGSLATKGNPTSSELIKVAIQAAVNTNKVAMSQLVADLNQFSIEHRKSTADLVRSQRYAALKVEQDEIARERSLKAKEERARQVTARKREALRRQEAARQRQEAEARSREMEWQRQRTWEIERERQRERNRQIARELARQDMGYYSPPSSNGGSQALGTIMNTMGSMIQGYGAARQQQRSYAPGNLRPCVRGSGGGSCGVR